MKIWKNKDVSITVLVEIEKAVGINAWYTERPIVNKNESIVTKFLKITAKRRLYKLKLNCIKNKSKKQLKSVIWQLKVQAKNQKNN